METHLDGDILLCCFPLLVVILRNSPTFDYEGLDAACSRSHKAILVHNGIFCSMSCESILEQTGRGARKRDVQETTSELFRIVCCTTYICCNSQLQDNYARFWLRLDQLHVPLLVGQIHPIALHAIMEQIPVCVLLLNERDGSLPDFVFQTSWIRL